MLDGFFFNFNLLKFIFKNNISKILFADLTLLVAQACHAGTVGLRGPLLPRHMHRRDNVMVPHHLVWRGKRFSNLIYQL
jgi:hypothetical protein